MKKITYILLALGASFVACSPAHAMGRMFKESVRTDPATLEEVRHVEPTDETRAMIQAVDSTGDTLGALGVPFAGMAGEVATGILSLVTLILTAKVREEKRGAQTIIKTVEREPGAESLKAQIMKQSVRDGTSAVIQRNVTKVT